MAIRNGKVCELPAIVIESRSEMKRQRNTAHKLSCWWIFGIHLFFFSRFHSRSLFHKANDERFDAPVWCWIFSFLVATISTYYYATFGTVFVLCAIPLSGHTVGPIMSWGFDECVTFDCDFYWMSGTSHDVFKKSVSLLTSCDTCGFA